MHPGLTRAAAGVREALPGRPPALRLAALGAGLVFVGSSVAVFYHIVDVVGGVLWLAAAVGATLVVATVGARVLPVRVALLVGLVAVVAGAGLYVRAAALASSWVLSVAFLVDLAAYGTGISVLQFKRVGVWAVAVAPGPVFLTWYLFLRRRYDWGVLVGGSALGFFVLTGDASWETALVGSLSALCVLSLGELERAGPSRARLVRLLDVLVVAVLGAQVVRHVGAASAASGDGGPGGSGLGSAGDGGDVASSSLVETRERVFAVSRITLSPEVLFTVTAARGVPWHVAAYDRYTGTGWVRTGETTPYQGSMPSPPGEPDALDQTVEVVRVVETMPAAWKPVRVTGSLAGATLVTSTGGLRPERPLEEGDSYTVRSRVPRIDPDWIRPEETPSPDAVAERYLQVPESTPARLRRRAREVTRGAETPQDAARAVAQWLRETKDYALDVDVPSGSLADAFVFELDAGYCVHFATAMTVILRTVGVPARFAHGYLPGEQVRGDRWVVRGFDSHAWCEVYVPDAGWVAFDPTPAGPREAAEQDALERARAEDREGVDTEETEPTATPAPTANESGSDGRTPDAAGEGAAGQPTPTGSANASGGSLPWPDRGLAASLSTSVSSMDRATFVAAVAGVAFGAYRLGLLERAHRALWVRRQPRTDSPQRDAERAFERLTYLLERRHRRKRPEETPRQYLDAIDPVDPRVGQVLRLYERAHYAETITRAEADMMVRLVDGLVRDPVEG